MLSKIIFIIFVFSDFLVSESFFANFNDLTWTKESWKKYTPYQIPSYPSTERLETMEALLTDQPPLIFVEEAQLLQRELIHVSKGNRFLFMGGDCAESFDDFSVKSLKDYCKLMLQIGCTISISTGLKTVKIGRIAGQFAKPRSSEFERYLNETILTFRGDIVHGHRKDDRVPDPSRLFLAYIQAVSTLNLLRAFTKGGFASLDSFSEWYIDTIDKDLQDMGFSEISRTIDRLHGFGISPRYEKILQETSLYTGHECLLLPYEQALTRVDPKSLGVFACSAHFLWIGERTRKIDAAQIEYLRGVQNPIGIKVSSHYTQEELLAIIKRVNPSNQMGKVTLMTRFGVEFIHELPKLILFVIEQRLNVVWVCDPMHGNTFDYNGIKTRTMKDIKFEIHEFFRFHDQYNTNPGGIHLEMTSLNVSEVIETRSDPPPNLDFYQSKCDPRLNGTQTLDVVRYTTKIYQEFISKKID